MAVSPSPRVFISSVMQNYEDFREAAAEGIRQAGCEPVMAEKFPASTVSPRTACLDGIQSVDAVVLLLGTHYGSITPSGLSATEEEYNEACKTHKRVFIFLEDVTSHEPPQEQFIKKVQDYVDGHWRKIYRKPAELQKLVKQALVEADLTSAQTTQNMAHRRIEDAFSAELFDYADTALLKIVWSTLRDEEVVDPLLFDDLGFQRTIMRIGHESNHPLLNYEHCKKKEATASRLRIIQGDPIVGKGNHHFVMLELDTRGTLIISQNVSGTVAYPPELEDIFFLDPTLVREYLFRAWEFAAAWWEYHDYYCRHDPLLYGVAFYHVGNRSFGSSHSSSLEGSVTIPLHSLPDPLVIFDQPRTVSRTNLRNHRDEIQRILKLTELRFRERDHVRF